MYQSRSAVSAALQTSLLSLSLFVVTTAQTATQHVRYEDLALDQTSVEDAKQILGEPLKEKTGSLEAGSLNSRLSELRKQHSFRTLEFKGDGIDYRKVRLSFLNDKLVMLDFEYQARVPVSELDRKVGISFEPFVSFSVTSSRYPLTYELIGESSNRLVVATCNSEINGSQPGAVSRVRQVSRAALGKQ